MKNMRAYWIHTLSPTHIGTGRGVGYIDLPIHREKITNWPIIPGSAFKGVLADYFGATEEKRKTDSKLALAFGKASDLETNISNSGALIPTDARLICLPIRSFHGTFAWCTSPLALQMLLRDLSLIGMANPPQKLPTPEEGIVHHTTTTKLIEGGRIYLEDLDFVAKKCDAATAWATMLAESVFPGEENIDWRARFIERFAVVPDTVFDFLTETGTEVDTRVRIDDELKTVKEGQLWNEESLPAETILSGLICCDRIFSKPPSNISAAALLNEFTASQLTLQIGGKATIGRGRVRCIFTCPKKEG